MTKAYPLQWPEGFPRTPLGRREKGQFKTPFDSALRNVTKSLELFGKDSGKKVELPVLSSNMDLLNRSPDDPGVSLWFTWDGLPVCIAVDRYTAPASNIQAIHHIIEARRVELRHGTLALVRATFQGFKALPPPTDKKPWREVLGFASDSNPDDRGFIDAAFRTRAKLAHPDAGGSVEAMDALVKARDEALKEIGAN